MGKAVLLVLSGGQDSTICAYWAKYRLGATEIHGLTFEYGQLHSIELDAAKSCADAVDMASHEIMKLGPVLKGKSPLTNSDEALEQYEDHGSLPGGLEKTFVPGRNALFLTLAANRAYVLGLNDIITGVCEEDSGGYPDCRQTFIDSQQQTLRLANEKEFEIHTPLMLMTKAESVQLAMELPGCYFQLAYSHTSYDGAYPPTGKDHATLLREKGFEEAGVPDPLVARAWMEGLMMLPSAPNYDWLRDEDPTTYTLAELCEKAGAK